MAKESRAAMVLLKNFGGWVASGDRMLIVDAEVRRVVAHERIDCRSLEASDRVVDIITAWHDAPAPCSSPGLEVMDALDSSVGNTYF